MNDIKPLLADKQAKSIKTALIHSSYSNEHRGVEHNERLEFLGDSVLSMIVAEYLYKKYPDKREGVLSKYSAALVRDESLADVANKLKLEEYIRMGNGCEVSRAILANTVEALIGALYLEKGYSEAEKFIRVHILSTLQTIIKHNLWVDPKSQLNEVAQARGYNAPHYKTGCACETISDQVFTSAAIVNNRQIGKGIGKTKKEAEQIAAMQALESL